MKKYITYIGILTIGVVLGWILFGNSLTKETENIPVWDTENNSWRSFNESSLISWEIYGE